MSTINEEGNIEQLQNRLLKIYKTSLLINELQSQDPEKKRILAGFDTNEKENLLLQRLKSLVEERPIDISFLTLQSKPIEKTNQNRNISQRNSTNKRSQIQTQTAQGIDYGRNNQPIIPGSRRSSAADASGGALGNPDSNIKQYLANNGQVTNQQKDRLNRDDPNSLLTASIIAENNLSNQQPSEDTTPLSQTAQLSETNQVIIVKRGYNKTGRNSKQQNNGSSVASQTSSSNSSKGKKEATKSTKNEDENDNDNARCQICKSREELSMWIGCEECEAWVHSHCDLIKNISIVGNDDKFLYYCPRCREKSNKYHPTYERPELTLYPDEYNKKRKDKTLNIYCANYKTLIDPYTGQLLSRKKDISIISEEEESINEAPVKENIMIKKTKEEYPEIDSIQSLENKMKKLLHTFSEVDKTILKQLLINDMSLDEIQSILNSKINTKPELKITESTIMPELTNDVTYNSPEIGEKSVQIIINDPLNTQTRGYGDLYTSDKYQKYIKDSFLQSQYLSEKKNQYILEMASKIEKIIEPNDDQVKIKTKSNNNENTTNIVQATEEALEISSELAELLQSNSYNLTFLDPCIINKNTKLTENQNNPIANYELGNNGVNFVDNQKYINAVLQAFSTNNSSLISVPMKHTNTVGTQNGNDYKNKLSVTTLATSMKQIYDVSKIYKCEEGSCGGLCHNVSPGIEHILSKFTIDQPQNEIEQLTVSVLNSNSNGSSGITAAINDVNSVDQQDNQVTPIPLNNIPIPIPVLGLYSSSKSTFQLVQTSLRQNVKSVLTDCNCGITPNFTNFKSLINKDSAFSPINFNTVNASTNDEKSENEQHQSAKIAMESVDTIIRDAIETSTGIEMNNTTEYGLNNRSISENVINSIYKNQCLNKINIAQGKQPLAKKNNGINTEIYNVAVENYIADTKKLSKIEHELPTIYSYFLGQQGFTSNTPAVSIPTSILNSIRIPHSLIMSKMQKNFLIARNYTKNSKNDEIYNLPCKILPFGLHQYAENKYDPMDIDEVYRISNPNDIEPIDPSSFISAFIRTSYELDRKLSIRYPNEYRNVKHEMTEKVGKYKEQLYKQQGSEGINEPVGNESKGKISTNSTNSNNNNVNLISGNGIDIVQGCNQEILDIVKKAAFPLLTKSSIQTIHNNLIPTLKSFHPPSLYPTFPYDADIRAKLSLKIFNCALESLERIRFKYVQALLPDSVASIFLLKAMETPESMHPMLKGVAGNLTKTIEDASKLAIKSVTESIKAEVEKKTYVDYLSNNYNDEENDEVRSSLHYPRNNSYLDFNILLSRNIIRYISKKSVPYGLTRRQWLDLVLRGVRYFPGITQLRTQLLRSLVEAKLGLDAIKDIIGNTAFELLVKYGTSFTKEFIKIKALGTTIDFNALINKTCNELANDQAKIAANNLKAQQNHEIDISSTISSTPLSALNNNGNNNNTINIKEERKDTLPVSKEFKINPTNICETNKIPLKSVIPEGSKCIPLINTMENACTLKSIEADIWEEPPNEVNENGQDNQIMFEQDNIIYPNISMKQQNTLRDISLKVSEAICNLDPLLTLVKRTIVSPMCGGFSFDMPNIDVMSILKGNSIATLRDINTLIALQRHIWSITEKVRKNVSQDLKSYDFPAFLQNSINQINKNLEMRKISTQENYPEEDKKEEKNNKKEEYSSDYDYENGLYSSEDMDKYEENWNEDEIDEEEVIETKKKRKQHTNYNKQENLQKATTKLLTNKKINLDMDKKIENLAENKPRLITVPYNKKQTKSSLNTQIIKKIIDHEAEKKTEPIITALTNSFHINEILIEKPGMKSSKYDIPTNSANISSKFNQKDRLKKNAEKRLNPSEQAKIIGTQLIQEFNHKLSLISTDDPNSINYINNNIKVLVDTTDQILKDCVKDEVLTKVTNTLTKKALPFISGEKENQIYNDHSEIKQKQNNKYIKPQNKQILRKNSTVSMVCNNDPDEPNFAQNNEGLLLPEEDVKEIIKSIEINCNNEKQDVLNKESSQNRFKDIPEIQITSCSLINGCAYDIYTEPLALSPTKLNQKRQRIENAKDIIINLNNKEGIPITDDFDFSEEKFSDESELSDWDIVETPESVVWILKQVGNIYYKIIKSENN